MTTSQSRYRTLIGNISRVYSAAAELRTAILKDGLDEIVSVINPQTANAWTVVKNDSVRLLQVWGSKEKDTASTEVITQITSLLSELSLNAPISDERSKVIIEELDEEVESKIEVTEKEKTIEEVVVEEEIIEEEEEVKVTEKEKTIEEVVVEEEIIEEEEEVAEEEEEEEVQIAEEVEESIEEEEEGLEVEPLMIRGRKYWLGSDNNIYAVIDDDDVGDAVGEMINNKPQFFAK